MSTIHPLDDGANAAAALSALHHSGAVAEQPPAELGPSFEERIREKARFFTKYPLTEWQRAVNESSYRLIQQDHSYLLDSNRTRLYDDAKHSVKNAGYQFKKRKRDGEVKRSHYGKRQRQQRIQSIAKEIEEVQKELNESSDKYSRFQASSFDQMAHIENVKKDSLEQSLSDLKSEKKMLEKKEKRSQAYQQRKKSSKLDGSGVLSGGGLVDLHDDLASSSDDCGPTVDVSGSVAPPLIHHNDHHAHQSHQHMSVSMVHAHVVLNDVGQSVKKPDGSDKSGHRAPQIQ